MLRRLNRGKTSLNSVLTEELILLVEKGHFIESKSILSKIEYEHLISKDKILFNLLKFETLNGLYDFTEVLEKIDFSLDLAANEKMVKELLQLLYYKSFALNFKNQLDDAIEVIEFGLKIIRNLSKSEQKHVSKEKAFLLLEFGYIHFLRKNYKKVSYYAKKVLRIFEELNFQRGIGQTFELLGLLNFGMVNITKAIDFFEESLEIYNKLEISHLILNCYYYLGRVYYYKGELNQSLEYLEKLRPFIEKYKDDYRVTVYLLYLVPLLLEKGDYSLAKKNTLEGLTLFNRIKRYDILGWAYYKLIQVFLSQDDISQANKYLEIIGSQNSEFGDETNWIDYKRLAEAQIYIKRGSQSYYTKAKIILNDLIDNWSRNIADTYEARYYLCRILLYEYLESGESEILEELNVLTKEILEFGNENDLIGYRIKASNIRLLTLWIQQQILPDVTKQQNLEILLVNVQRIAERIGLKTIAREFSDEHLKLLQQKHALEDIIKIYFPSAE